MKMIYITSNISVFPQVREMLDTLMIDSYQVIERAWSKSPKGDKRFDDPVWPGYNVIIFVQTDNNNCLKITSKLKIINDNAHNDNELITGAEWSLDKLNS